MGPASTLRRKALTIIGISTKTAARTKRAVHIRFVSIDPPGWAARSGAADLPRRNGEGYHAAVPHRVHVFDHQGVAGPDAHAALAVGPAQPRQHLHDLPVQLDLHHAFALAVEPGDRGGHVGDGALERERRLAAEAEEE